MKLKKSKEIKTKKEKKVRKNKKFPYSKLELIFDVISLLFAIGVGLYFGTRSFYYYSKQTTKAEKDAVTLNGSIILNNPVATEGPGLHQDTNGYYFKGNVDNNYVKFANRLFRVIRINNDNSVRVIADDIATEFSYGETEDYKTSNLSNWLNKKEENANTGVYYDTIPDVDKFLVKTKFSISTFDGTNVTPGEEEIEEYITSLDIKDYSNANGKNSYLNINKYFWLVGVNEEGSNLYVSEDGSLLDGASYDSYGIRPVFTFKPNFGIIGGIGTKEDPFVIDQGDSKNYVDTYVKIDNDMWKVYYDRDGFLKLVYCDYSSQGMAYSDTNSEFNPSDKDNIAYFLNTTLYNSIAYNEYLEDFVTITGEVGNDTSLDFLLAYYANVVTKVSLPSLYDYNNSGLDDYYLSNTISTIGSLANVYHDYGLLEEANVEDLKRIVPVICIKRSNLKEGVGDGSLSNPFVVR